MPIKKVSGGFKWGNKGKTYSNREGAVKQAQAAYANGYKGDSNEAKPSKKKSSKSKKKK